jgi:DNA-directed RNA polymerase II subunit RPB1
MSDVGDIIGIEFSLKSDEFIKKFNNITVTVPDTGSNKDVQGSVASGFMGSVNDRYFCPTCAFTKTKCTGHSGYITLGTHICNTLFIEQIIKYLNIICFKCGGIVVPVPEGATLAKICSTVTNKKKKAKLTCENVVDMVNGNPVFCGAVHPNIYEEKKNSRSVIMQEFYDIDQGSKKKIQESISILPPDTIHKCFSKITTETLRFLEIKDPELAPVNMLNSLFYVPPNSVRPNANSAKTSKNDINVQLNAILKESQKLGNNSLQTDDKKNIATISEIQKLVFNLQRGSNTGSEKQLVSIFSMLSGKTGIIRGAVLGARVFGVGRLFITGNPDARLDEVYIPEKMAAKISIPVTVTKHNLGELMRFVANGDKEYPKCHGIFSKKRNAFFLASHAKNMILEPGDVVYRDIITGDLHAFCRQPTLQLSNITFLKIIVEKYGKTFNFNPNITTCYNADFDGDAINLYCAPDNISSFEGRTKAYIDEMLISNSYGRPIVGQVQDGVLGLSLLTMDGIYLNLLKAAYLFDNTGLKPDLRQFSEKGLISGRHILSALFNVLKLKINYSGQAKYYNGGAFNAYRTYSPTEINVNIVEGVFKSGIIDGATVGNKAYNNLYHNIYNKYGAKSMRDIIWYMQRIAINYIALVGFSMHINDFRIRSTEDKKIREYELSITARSQAHTENLYLGNLVAPSNTTVRDHYENGQINILSENQTFNAHIHEGMDYRNNNLYHCVHTGTKGSSGNIIDGIVSPGQQLLDGARLPLDLGGRSSHFYCRFSDDPRSRGFVANSYATGLTPSDMASAAIPHRRGIVSKALSTADSGKKYRDGVCSLNSNILNNARQVVKGSKMRQLLYGGDGMDPRATFKTVTGLVFKTEAELRKIATGEELATLIRERNFCRDIFVNQQHRTGEKVGKMGFIPVNIPLILKDVELLAGKEKPYAEAFKTISAFIDTIPRLYVNTAYEGDLPLYYSENCKLFQAFLRWELRSEITSKWTKKQVDVFIYLVSADFINNLEDPGTAVGIRGIQATSEIGTQNMLDSIHAKAGPKIAAYKNIMDAVGTIKMIGPRMEIFFKPEITEEEIHDFAKKIEMLQLDYFVNKYQIFYEKQNIIVHPLYKDENKMIAEKSKIIEFPRDVLPWCVRLEFNIARIVVKNISMEDIYMQISRQFPFVHVIFNTLNAENPVMRVYLRQLALHKYNLQNSTQVDEFVQDLLKSIMRGVDRIKTARVQEKAIATVENDVLVEKNLKYVETDGTNLRAILAFPEVNAYYTKSNGIFEMQEIYGICGAYTAVIDGLRMSIEGAHNTHYTILANEMCSKSFYSAINRNGSAKRDSSVCQLIADGSFMSVLKKATLKGKKDYNIGVNSSYIMGTTPKVGTNYVEVICNENFIESEGEKNLQELEDI